MPKKAKSIATAATVERDVTVHDIAAHMQKLGGDDPKKQDNAATYLLQRYTEDGLAIRGGSAEKSPTWYAFWGTPAKCPTCGAPAKHVNEPVKGEV